MADMVVQVLMTTCERVQWYLNLRQLMQCHDKGDRHDTHTI